MGLNFGHFVGDRVTAVAGQPVNASSHREVGSELLGRAEEFVDVALAVIRMHPSLGLPE